MTPTDYSPADDEPTFEQVGTWFPANRPKFDADGSITGCAGGHPFGLTQTRIASVEVGELVFRCEAHTRKEPTP